MNLYQMASDHIGGRQYPWVGGYGPLGMDEMLPFLSGMPESQRLRTLKFWELNDKPPGLEIDPGGRQWSDFIGYGGSLPPFFVSDTVIKDLKENGIDILRATEMPIAKISAKGLQKITPPKYYILEALPGIERAWDAMGVPLDTEGKPVPHSIASPLEVHLRLSSWNGLDLFSFSDGPQTAVPVCTDRVKKLAECKGWTNVRFKPIKVVP